MYSLSPLFFSFVTHFISAHFDYWVSSLTLSTLCPSSLSSFLHFFLSSSFLFISSYPSLLFSLSLSSPLFTSHSPSSLSLTSLTLLPLSSLSSSSSLLSPRIHSLPSTSLRNYANHLDSHSLILPIPSSLHLPFIPPLSHFSLFPLIHFTMVLFAFSPKLNFAHFIYHTLSFIIPTSFPSVSTSITLITNHPFLP